MLNYFDRVFTRHEFVRLENNAENDNEASPSGFEKQYSILMKYFDLSPSHAHNGLVIGDNDYDISSDTPGLSTLIIDSLYTPTEAMIAVIDDYFNNKNHSKELGIKVKEFNRKHPISGLESKCFEIELPEELYHSELDKIELSKLKRHGSSNRRVTKAQKKSITRLNTKSIQLKANRFGLM